MHMLAQRHRLPWWQQAFSALRAPLWQAVLAVTSVVGLLMAFQRVVVDGVRQAEMRREAQAALADSVWRCNALRGARQREGCHAQVKASLNVETALTANPGAMPMTVVAVGR